jgi:hypothetical protein
MTELEHLAAAIQRLIPLVDELTRLGCNVEVTASVNGHTIGIASRTPDEVDQVQ